MTSNDYENMKNAFFTVLALIVIILGGIRLSAVQKAKPSDQEQKVIRIGHTDLPSPVFIAETKGFFAKAQLKVQLQRFSNSNLLIEALERGDIDATASISYSTLFAFESRKPGTFKVYNGFSENQDTKWSAIITKKNGNIKTITDLKGKKIVIASGSAVKIQASRIVQGLGLHSEDVDFVSMERNLILPTFSKDEISAFIGTEPTATLLIEKGGGVTFIASPRVTYLQNPYPTAGSIISTTFLQTNPETAQAFLRVMNDATNFIRKNEAESKMIFGTYLNLEPTIASRMGLPHIETASEINIAAVEHLADFEVQNKILDKKPDIGAFFLKD